MCEESTWEMVACRGMVVPLLERPEEEAVWAVVVDVGEGIEFVSAVEIGAVGGAAQLGFRD